MQKSQDNKYNSKELNFTYRDYVQNGESLENQKIGNYTILQLIGRGAYGQIYLATDQQKNKYAVKLLDLVSVQREPNPRVKAIRERLIISEPKLMQVCDSPNLLKCFEVMENDELKILILEYCSGKNLQEYIDEKKSLPEEEAIGILKQIINGIAELHKHSIVHRDLKAENIMEHNGVYKIIDFGFSKKLEIATEKEQVKGTTLGTITTMAPQVFKRMNYGLKADIWSIGVIFFQMIYGTIPYDSLTANKRYDEISSEKYLNPNEPLTLNGKTASKEATAFLKDIIVVDTHKRLDWRSLINHEYLKQDDKKITQRFLPRTKLKVPIVQEKLIEQKLKIESDTKISQQKQEDSKKKTQREQQTKDRGKGKYQINFKQMRKNDQEQEQTNKTIKLSQIQINQIKKTLNNQQQKEFKWTNEAHLQCLKTQFIYDEIFEPIQKYKLLDFEDRSVIQFMYLLLERCFNNMSPINLKVKSSQNNSMVKQLSNQVTPLYNIVSSKFYQYSNKLTDAENNWNQIFKDFFKRNVFQRSQTKKKNEIISGIEIIGNNLGDYTKQEQIHFTNSKYIKDIISKLNLGENKSKRIRNILNRYNEINNIRLEGLKGQTYFEYLNTII